jgi:putative PIN family toxin of toxin-antitoxin system
VIRAVLDTNVVISGILHSDGVPGRLLRAALEERRFQLVTSLPILVEVGVVLRRPRITMRHGWGPREVNVFLALLHDASLVVEGQHDLEVITEDPSDNMFLAAAEAGEAGYIVSGDRHLLSLEAYGEIAILRPQSFLQLLPDNP